MNIHADIARSDAFITCPHCGSDHYDDNRLDETRCREGAATELSLLRFEGKIDEAEKLLTALSKVHIRNFLRNRWRCLECGVTFDD
jgi:rubrerythrin